MRKHAPLILLAAMLLSAPGCAFLSETNPEPQWSTSRWKEQQEENRQRLAGEDHGTSTASDYLLAAPRTLWSGVSWTWDEITGNNPRHFAAQMLDPNADLRRQAIYEISDHRWGRAAPYTKFYGHLAEADMEPTVRTAAIRALNRSRDRAFLKVYVAALGDTDPNVRLEAAKALANIPDSSAAAPLMKALANTAENRDVRLASADALREYRTSEVAQALIRVLNDRDFGVAWQSRGSLCFLTGVDHGYNQETWLAYITGPSEPFR